MTRDELITLSREWEKKTGYDSIGTIVRVYERRESGAYVCPWPHCDFARKDPVTLWKHVHTAHGNNCLPVELPDDAFSIR